MLVLTLAAAGLAAGGCGSAPSPRRARPPAATPRPAPTSTPAPRPAVDLTAPTAGARVKATAAGAHGLRATITVQGFAPPGSRVRLSSACRAPGCRRTVEVPDDGVWEGRLALVASRAHPAARLRAASSVPGPPRHRRVRLHAARPAVVPVTHHRSGGAAKARAPALPAAGTLPPASTTGAPSGASPVRRLVLIGDSLAVGIEPLLPSLLPGWSIRTDALTGRPLAAGMPLIAAADLRSRPTVLAVSLFTNDDPRAVATLATAVQRSVGLVGAHGCAVWATIVRPPVAGTSYAAANRTLEQLAARNGGALLVVPWAAQVAAHPAWLGPDGVHATPAGYLARARMYAQAARTCAR